MKGIISGFAHRWLSRGDDSELAAGLPRRLAVGWSGGADSTALLLALHSVGYQVSAWHIDHAWRQESAGQARALEQKAKVWGIPFFLHTLTTPESSNLEAVARQARYRQFETWADEQEIDCLCLGHHLDDQAETVCMRLLQGSGPVGCQGMKAERQHGRLRVVRPLLHVAGEELRQALCQAGVTWLEDPSNQDTRFRRNFVRHQLFPAMRQAGASPESLFVRWGKQAEILAARLDCDAEAIIAGQSRGAHVQKDRVSILWQEWAQASQSVRARVLQKMMNQLLGEGFTPGRRHILLAETWTRKSGLGGLDLSRCRLQRGKRFLHLDIAQADSRNSQVA